MNTGTVEPGPVSDAGGGPLQEVVLRVTGMHCASCVGRVERMLARAGGVRDVAVSLPSERAIVRGHRLDPAALARIVENLGFEATPLNQPPAPGPAAHDPSHDAHHAHHAHLAHGDDDGGRRSPWLWRVIAGAAMLVPLKALHWGAASLGVPMGAAVWISAIVGTFAVALVGWPFYSGAIKALRSKAATMDTLVALGATAALLVSWAGVAEWLTAGQHGSLYFAEAVALMTLIGLGRLLESRLSAVTATDTRALLQAQPERAIRVRTADDHHGQPIATAQIVPGDLILVPAGERVPVDGTLERGESAFDEAVLTGESMPVERSAGEPVVAGAINAGHAVVIRAAVDGRSTTIARIAAMIERARASKVPMQALADRITMVFVPAILLIAALAFIGWWLIGGLPLAQAGTIAATVLVIACPCALGLATPLAVMAGVGGAARQGVFLRDAAALQRAASVRTVLFDKTGTLTAGKPRVIAGSDEALALAASVCAASSHPVARAIVDAAHQRNLAIPPAESTQEHAGAGMAGTVSGASVRVLSQRAAERAGLSLPSSVPAVAEGASISYVFRNDQPVDALALRDELRQGAASAIAALRDMGLSARMLSGDRLPAARAAGAAVGLTDDAILAELTPADKLQTIARLAADPATGPVAMVGDGINDAPALAEASARGGVAIAIGSGTAAAIDSADAIAPGDRLASVPALLSVAARTVSAIKTNLALAFVYNSAAVPLAALGMLGEHGPLVAAIAMALSNVCVVGNSALLALRLRRSPRSAP